MVKFAHISNYSDLMGFTIFKCGSGYQEKSQSTFIQLVGIFVMPAVSVFLPKSGNRWNFSMRASALFQIGKPIGIGPC